MRLLVAVVTAAVFMRKHRPAVVMTNTMTIPSFAIAARLLGVPHYWIVREFGNRDHDLDFLLGYRAHYSTHFRTLTNGDLLLQRSPGELAERGADHAHE